MNGLRAVLVLAGVEAEIAIAGELGKRVTCWALDYAGDREIDMSYERVEQALHRMAAQQHRLTIESCRWAVIG